MEPENKTTIEKLNGQLEIEKKLFDMETELSTTRNIVEQSIVQKIMAIGESDRKLNACKFLNYRLKHTNIKTNTNIEN